MRAAFITGDRAGFALATGISSRRIYSYRIGILWREFVTILTVSLQTAKTALAYILSCSNGTLTRPLPVGIPHTYSTLPFSVGIDEKIFPEQRMAALAVTFLRIQRGHCDAIFQGVGEWINNPHMPRIDALSIAAQMVNNESGRDRRNVVLVGNAVRSACLWLVSFLSDLHARIAIWVNHLEPIPAASRGING